MLLFSDTRKIAGTEKLDEEKAGDTEYQNNEETEKHRVNPAAVVTDMHNYLFIFYGVMVFACASLVTAKRRANIFSLLAACLEAVTIDFGFFSLTRR